MKQKARNTYDLTRNKRGFTLVEVLVVIVIIALIAAVSIAGFRNGERSQRVQIAADTAVNAVSVAENLALAPRQTEFSDCDQGNAPAAYFAQFNQNLPSIRVQAISKCGFDFRTIVESYPLPSGTRIRPGSFLIDNAPVDMISFIFPTPFASVGYSSNWDFIWHKFNSASFILETEDGQTSKQINIDGLSGKIGISSSFP